jgi:hypothetical protein
MGVTGMLIKVVTAIDVRICKVYSISVDEAVIDVNSIDDTEPDLIIHI